MNSGQGVNYEDGDVSVRVLMTAESSAVPLYPVISRYSILFSYNRFARGHTEEIRAREIVKSHDDSLETRILEFVFLRVEFLSVYALSPDAASWYT